jgi:hypothetical protein
VNEATRDYPAGDLRVSDADRDRVVSELSEHFQAGRLTADEFDERSGRALSARTEGELAALLADLPRERQTVTPPAGGQPVAAQDADLPVRMRRSLIAVPVVAIAAIVAVVATVSGGHHALIGGVPSLLVIVIVARLIFRRNRRDRWQGSDRDRWGNGPRRDRWGDGPGLWR